MRFIAALLCLAAAQSAGEVLLHPESSEFTRPAPAQSVVTLVTSKGEIDIEVHRDWAPRCADRFYNLARLGYYTDIRFTRVVKERWAQFGINGTPAIAKMWRAAEFANDPFIPEHSNVLGTVAFAFKDQKALTTQVFINLQDNHVTHDVEPFVPFGRIIRGVDVALALNTEYGDNAGGGIRGGKQDPLFEGGNAYIDRMYPKLDKIMDVKVR